MTNKEAQIIIGNIPIKPEVLDDCYSIAEYQEAKDMAIKALEQEPMPDTRQRERQLEMEYQHGYDKGWEEGRKALEQEPCDKCVYSTKDGCQYDDITEAIPPLEPCEEAKADE